MITVTTSSRLSPLTFAEVHSYLVAHENLLQRQNNLPSLPSINSPFAYVVRSGLRPPYNPKPSYHNPNPRPAAAPPQYRPNNQHQVRPNNQNQFRPNQPNTFAPCQTRPWTPNTSFEQISKQTESKPQCQICAKFGHTAKNCYFWYNLDKVNSQSPSTHHAYVAQSTMKNEDHSSNWILDSGATNHVTSDINNISSFYAYEGIDHLKIANG